MPKMIQIRDVPDDVHRVLKSRAAVNGISLSDYIKNELKNSAAQLTIEEWLARVSRSKTIPKKQTGAQIIRELRDSR